MTDNTRPASGSVMQSDQPAISAVQLCPYQLGKDGVSPKWKVPRQQVVPCDLKSVSLTLIAPNGETINVIGRTPSARETPIPSLDDITNQLLNQYAAVIQYVAPALAAGAAAPSHTNQASVINAAKLRGQVSMVEIMRATCGKHGEVVRAPEFDPKKPNGDSRHYIIEVGAKDWTAMDFIKGVLGGGNLPEFVNAQRKAVAFEANSCARPAIGDPVGQLSAVAELVIADEWRVDFRWGQGLAINFTSSETHAKDKRDGTETVSSSKSFQANSDKKPEETRSTEMTRKGADGKEVILYSSQSSPGSTTPTNTADLSRNAGNSIERDVAIFKPTDSAALTKLKSLADAQRSIALNQGLALTVTRNGKTVLDTDQWGKAIQSLQEIINTFNDFLFRLMLLLETGAKVGIPVSITFKVDFQLRALQGLFYLRVWPEATSPVKSGAYYLSGFRPRFQAGMDLLLLALTLKPTITFQAKFLHEYIASATISLEGMLTGSRSIGFNVSDGMSSTPFNFDARIRASIKATGEVSAASFYAKAEGEVSSGIFYNRSLNFDGESLKWSDSRVVSHRIEATITVRTGNKVWDYFNLGSSEPDWQWPSVEEGPFIWLKEGALNKTW